MQPWIYSLNYYYHLLDDLCKNAGSVYTGVDFCKRLCGVSVIRRYLSYLRNHNHFRSYCIYELWVLDCFVLCSGESMENALRACCKGIKIGKILIHREGDNGQQVC